MLLDRGAGQRRQKTATRTQLRTSLPLGLTCYHLVERVALHHLRHDQRQLLFDILRHRVPVYAVAVHDSDRPEASKSGKVLLNEVTVLVDLPHLRNKTCPRLEGKLLYDLFFVVVLRDVFGPFTTLLSFSVCAVLRGTLRHHRHTLVLADLAGFW